MSRTTDQWQKLLEGATPGPWRIDTSDPDWPQLTGPVVLEGNLITQEILADVGGELNDPNLYLAAAAPEAVDEVIRLRRELEKLREDCLESAETHEKNARFSHTSQALEACADELRDTAHDLTRILNGESNV